MGYLSLLATATVTVMLMLLINQRAAGELDSWHQGPDTHAALASAIPAIGNMTWLCLVYIVPFMTVGIGLGVALSWSSGEMQRRGARLVLNSAAEALKCSLEASPLFAALSWLLQQDSLPLSTYQDIRQRSFIYWICSVLLWFIIFDLLMYLQHRLTHSTRFLYDSVHYHHHKLRPLVTPVVLVFGAVDMALMALAAIAPTLIITMHWGTIFLCVAAIIVYSFLTHNLDMDFMAGSRLMVSSRSHGKHHQYGMDACNYGVITNCWDLLFSTYREP